MQYSVSSRTAINSKITMANCTGTITVTSQDDIDNSPLAKCSDPLLVVEVHNSNGTLNFPSITQAQRIDIHDCPQLESVDFPDLTFLNALNVTQTPALTQISFPKLVSPSDGMKGFDFAMVINKAPALTELISANISAVSYVEIFDTGFQFFHEGSYNALGLNEVRHASIIVSDACIYFAGMQSVQNFSISGPNACPEAASALTTVENFTWTNAISEGDYDKNSVSLFQINGSLVLEATEFQERGHVDLWRALSAGDQVNITANRNADIDLSQLATVGSTMRIQNNTNCTFNLDKLSAGQDIYMLDNMDTVLPALPGLQSADNIHFRGIISTSSGPNIFPFLKYVSGTVTIEAWNNDFDCSKLVSLQRDHIIHNLICNGTNGTQNITNSLPGASPSSSGLMASSWAGIGIGIAVVVIGVAVTLFWRTRRHYRRKLQDMTDKKRTSSSSMNVPREGLWASALVGLIEAEGRGVVRELPEDYIREMHVPPAELPAHHLSPTHELAGSIRAM
ncbi:hypothetical protein F4777DRAFT_232982 [Nemania sp. FL0916]|nr:hypothetical protein F4777DRAFT_232982 [Nemania sp. FL0916]